MLKRRRLPLLISTLAGAAVSINLLAARQGQAVPPAAPAMQQAPPKTGGDATAVMAAAREALGGDKKLAAVKSFVATGRTRQVRGDNLVPIEFEIDVEFPDKYVRKDEIPAQESGPTSSGFNGDGLIQLPPPAAPPAMPPGAAAGRAGAPGVSPEAALEMMRKSRVNALRQDFVKLTLGMFAGSFPGAPVTFSLAGKAEAPQGTADVVDVKGANGLSLQLFINSQTHLPIMVAWTAPVPPARGAVPPGAPRAGAAGAAAGAPAAAPPPAPPTTKIYYAEYRDAGNGVQFPFRLRRAVGADTVEETNFDGFKINSKIDPRKFEVVK